MDTNDRNALQDWVSQNEEATNAWIEQMERYYDDIESSGVPLSCLYAT